MTFVMDRVFGSKKIDSAVKLPPVVEKAQAILSRKTKSNANEIYQILCQLYGEIGLERNVTRIVALGQQSMGKTTLLNTIMGLPVGYTSSGCGTKCPVEYHLRPSDDNQNPEEVQLWLDGRPCEPENLQRAMNEIMRKQTEITETPIKVEIAGPRLLHGTFVDLPGIQVDDDEKMEVSTRVARTYIEGHPMDVFILVTKADDDYNNRPAPVLRVMGMLDPKRTIYVATHALTYFQKKVNEMDVDQILIDLNSLHGPHVKSSDQFAVELYQLSQDNQTKAMSEQRDLLYIATRRRHEDVLEAIGKAKKRGPSTASMKLRKQTDLYEMAKAIEERFQPTLKRSLRQAHERTQSQHTVQCLVRQNLVNEIDHYERGNLYALVEQFLGDYVERCHNITTGCTRVQDIEVGGTVQENLEEGHRKAEDLFAQLGYDADTLEAVQQRASEYIKREKRLGMKGAVGRNRHCIKPSPSPEDAFHSGQFVRLEGGKFGFINRRSDPDELTVTYIHNSHDPRSHRVSSTDARLLVPLGLTSHWDRKGDCTAWWCPPLPDDDSDDVSAARRRQEKHRLQPVTIRNVFDEREEDTTVFGWEKTDVRFLAGKAIIAIPDVPQKHKYYSPAHSLPPSFPLASQYPCRKEATVDTDELFLEFEPIENLNALLEICGRAWETRVVANYAFKMLGTYLQYLITHTRPDCELDVEHIFNTQESRPYNRGTISMGKTVESILKTNIDTLLKPLVRLMAGCGWVATHRVLLAAYHQMRDLSGSRFGQLLDDSRFCQELAKAVTQFADKRARSNAIVQEEMLDRAVFDGPSCFEKARYLRRACVILRQEASLLGLSLDESKSLEVFEQEVREIEDAINAKCSDQSAMKSDSNQPLETKVRLMFLEKADLLGQQASENFHADFAQVLKHERLGHPLALHLTDYFLKDESGRPITKADLEEQFLNPQRKKDLQERLSEIEPEIRVLELAEQCHDYLTNETVDFLLELMAPLKPAKKYGYSRETSSTGGDFSGR